MLSSFLYPHLLNKCTLMEAKIRSLDSSRVLSSSPLLDTLVKSQREVRDSTFM